MQRLLDLIARTYRVRAVDVAGNLSTYSSVATTTPPTVLTGLSTITTSKTGVDLTWRRQTAARVRQGYRLEHCQEVGCD